jgi:hypothetical protein
MIYILYRHTSNISGLGKNRPKWFSYDKSLENILETIEGLDFVQLHLMFDGNYTSNDPRIHHVECFKGGSDWASYLYTWQYAKNLNIGDKDIIYIAENDYMFVKGWPRKIMELYQMYEDISYVSLYDHPDKYTHMIYADLTSAIYHTKTHHWRTVPNTTGSIIFNKQILEEDYDIHTSNASDFGRFEYLRQNRQRFVLTPVPSLATHCEVEYLAPIINWESIAHTIKL